MLGAWVEHMTLDNETGLDRPGKRVRPVSGVVAADYFALGYFLAHIGYEEKTMYMSLSDWRISFQNTEGTPKGRNLANTSNCDIWTEYSEMGVEGIGAVADYRVYTAGSILDLLHYVAPKMMKRGDAHFSHGIADNLDDPKYKHYKYWSNPLETTLPNAPAMEIYLMYGVGIPTERAYVY